MFSRLQFSLLAFFAFVALAAVSFLLLKHASTVTTAAVNGVLLVGLLLTTLGAIQSIGRWKRFCQAFAIIAWTYTLFVYLQNSEYEPTAKLLEPVWRVCRHEFTSESSTEQIDPFDVQGDDPFARKYEPIHFAPRLNDFQATGRALIILTTALVAGLTSRRRRKPLSPNSA